MWTDFTSTKHLSLIVLWTVYSIGIIAVGITMQSSTLRPAGIALLGITFLEQPAYDVFLLEAG
jgi:uncharacterized membrane protein